MFDMNAVELKEALIDDIKADLVPMVTSSPGMGKSDIIREIAKQFRLKIFDMRMSQCEPVDMQGYPGTTDNGRMTFFAPEYFPLEADPVPEGYDGWLLFLDEFNSGHKQTEAAAYKLILDRAVDIHKLHPRCMIICAGNLSTDRAIVNTASTATTSRLVHRRLRIDHNIWIDWANGNDIDHRIISLIKFKPPLLHKFDVNTAEVTYPCPRTWEFASRMIRSKPDIDNLTKVRLAGTVGEGAAVELATYASIYKSLPTISQILADPQAGWRVPTEPSEQYAVTTMLSHNINEENIDKIMIAVGRLPTEMQVVTFKDIYKRAPELKSHDLIKEWISKNASVIF